MFNFFIAALVVALAPGPDNLFVLAQSATHGARAGFSVICGLCTGICVQTVLLIVGVSALIAASPIAFFVLQCCGAAYLVYLAYKSFQVRAGVVKKFLLNSPKANRNLNWFSGCVFIALAIALFLF